MLLRRKTHKGPVGPSCCHRLKLVSLFLGTGGSGESGFTWDIYALAFGGTDGWLSVGMSQGICLLHVLSVSEKQFVLFLGSWKVQSSLYSSASSRSPCWQPINSRACRSLKYLKGCHSSSHSAPCSTLRLIKEL